jgi:hypothetical protein
LIFLISQAPSGTSRGSNIDDLIAKYEAEEREKGASNG